MLTTFKRTSTSLAAALLLAAAAAPSLAAETVFGTIAFHNDIRSFDFVMASAGTVNIQSHSWQYGLNFDPAAALWQQSSTGYALLAANDDDALSDFDPLGNFDFRLQLNLGAGSYRLTLLASPNAAAGNLLSQGFTADAETPIALADWTQPGSNPNFPDQKGGDYSIVFDGISGVTAVPEPATWLLLAVGAAGLLVRRTFVAA